MKDEERRTARAEWPVRVFRSFEEADRADEEFYASLTPGERMGMVWPITLDAWAFTGKANAESRLQRHIVRVRRRRSKAENPQMAQMDTDESPDSRDER